MDVQCGGDCGETGAIQFADPDGRLLVRQGMGHVLEIGKFKILGKKHSNFSGI